MTAAKGQAGPHHQAWGPDAPEPSLCLCGSARLPRTAGRISRIAGDVDRDGARALLLTDAELDPAVVAVLESSKIVLSEMS